MTRPRRLPWHRTAAFLGFFAVLAMGQDRPDLVVANFEGVNYLPWIEEGNAFGRAPARGAFSGQMPVEGFEGRGLVNSFRGGDESTGTLTSPAFTVERPHINFLIGGGKYPGGTCLDLLLDGVVVRTATGPNDKPGGSERLDWASWNVADLVGKFVVLRVVDHRRGGWGHINVDQIVQSDRGRGLVESAREFPIESRYLHLPISEKAPVRRVKISDGELTREFDLKLAEGKPDFSSFLDLAPFRGKNLRIQTRLPNDSKAMEGITQADSIPDSVALYRENGRPQFHFTSRRGWLNDPNGLVFFEGEYHLFYQHNPYGWDWGNMHWGHAVSPDLVHWSELPIAIFPRQYGDWAFSGSAVVDRENTSGFGDGKAPPLVAAYTSTGRGECIVFSLDRGRTWAEFAGNPVVKHVGRDPRLLWHEPSKRWVMAVYDEEGGKRDVAFYSSTDLKAWTFASRISGFFECPDLFELPVEDCPGKTLWVLSAADGAYLLGQFDGKTFTPEPGGKQKVWHGNFYAAQTFSDEPKGRRVQVGWAQGIAFPGKPFNQQMNIPCELTLRSTDQGVRMFANPVTEVDSLRSGSHSKSNAAGSPGANIDSTVGVGELFDLKLATEVGASGEVKLTVPGATLSYDVARKILECNGVSVPLEPISGRIKLRLLVDKGSIEVFGNDGRVAISRALTEWSGKAREAKATSNGDGQRSLSIEVDSLQSSWR
jgi:fructan beta-fructosidase